MGVPLLFISSEYFKIYSKRDLTKMSTIKKRIKSEFLTELPTFFLYHMLTIKILKLIITTLKHIRDNLTEFFSNNLKPLTNVVIGTGLANACTSKTVKQSKTSYN